LATTVDTSLFRQGNHSPSYFTLSRMSGTDDLVDFCIPCNPYFPPPEMFERLAGNLEGILKFYPSANETITGELATVLGMPPQAIAMANGSTELITWIDHLLITESMATPVPTFGRWTDQSLETGKRVDMFPLTESAGFSLNLDAYIEFVRAKGSRVAVLSNPNNPDGGYIPRWDVVRMMDAFADLDLVVVDESFIDFVDAEEHPSVARDAMLRHNVLVLKSLGKNFGLHGVRFGYVVGNPALVKKIGSRLPKWNLNSMAETVVFMLAEYLDEYRQSLQLLSRDRAIMIDQLCRVPGLLVYPSQGNFVLVKLPQEVEGPALRDHLLTEHGVVIRECGNKLGITNQFCRLVVRPEDDVAKLISAMGEYMWNQQQSQGLSREPAWQVYERQQSAVSAARQPQLQAPPTPSSVTPMPALAREPREEYERPATGGIPREFSRQTLREAVPPAAAMEEQVSPRGFARRAREAAAAAEAEALAAEAAAAAAEDDEDGGPQQPPWYLQGREESRRPGLRPRPPLRVASGGR
jgi:histidinol-phosphate/aromatic aminotransferase/cobyric acid decarboxylase-like protein